jgi:hypothetical protein
MACTWQPLSNEQVLLNLIQPFLAILPGSLTARFQSSFNQKYYRQLSLLIFLVLTSFFCAQYNSNSNLKLNVAVQIDVKHILQVTIEQRNMNTATDSGKRSVK